MGNDFARKTLENLADKIVRGTNELIEKARSEEDLRIGFEILLEPIKSELNLKSNPEYEKSYKKSVYSGRSDAVHGRLIIEYENPKSFRSERNIDHAFEQLISYLSGEMERAKDTRFVGVGFDGKQIFFVQYQDKNWETIDRRKFVRRGPYDFTPESARTFLIHLRALSRLPLNAENLAQKFGPQSDLALQMVSAFANALKYWGDQTHICTFFNEWKRLFGIVYGEQFSGGHQEKEAKTLSKLYKVRAETDFQELLFSVHTYFAFLMKLIAAELLTLRETSFGSSLASQLAHISDKELKQQLEDIENGGIYARKGITNFLEGDFFRWYLDAFDSPELKEAIREIARALSEFEPATSTLDPVSTRDLLKKLYQYLVPQEVRHRLGEYYTPDWLAELLLNEVGYDGNTLKRFLDPACGSGTFLVLAIQRAKEYGQKEKWPPLEIAKRIVANIWGFDLNPLAVIAARTNYLFALGDLINELERVEIPIYLTDSVLTPTRITGNLYGEFLEVSTSVGKFQIPAEWVRVGGFLLANAAPLVEEMAKNQYSVDEAMTRFKNEGLVFSNNEQIVKDFYKQILELEKQNKNGIWARFLKNAFAPMFAGKFDFVVGNPPWIRWGYLSEDYRKATFNLWVEYGLFPKTQDFAARRLGGGEKDFSMLFVYASADYYLKDGAKLGFLITQEVFKSKGAGEGFRRFQLGDKKYLKVLKAHDLVSIQPFEGAANKTAAIILKKGEKTEYPVLYTVWAMKKGVGRIATDKLLDEVLPLLQKKRLIAHPIGRLTGSWQTISDAQRELTVIAGRNPYKARRGASTEPYGVFWLEIKQVLSNGNIIVCNLAEKGKRYILKRDATIEPDLVYPAVRGRDIQRWGIESKIFVLIPYPFSSNTPYTETELKNNFPRTYAYFTQFKDILLSRGSKFLQNLAEKTSFFTMFGIGDYTFARYKVLWKRMANDIVASVVSQAKTPFGYKTVIGTDTTALFATNNESEAHYLCAIINSKPVRDFIKSFSSAGRGFGTP
ncbi:MAG: Eco57I restriction-modification methylase domain-containing protein, partial [Candidatus Kapaibacteriota bacterium]